MAAAPQHIDSGWRAELQLGFKRNHARTLLTHRKHIGPLVVQRPFYPEGDVCHIYLVHPPGGIVGGDRLHLSVTVDAQAHALITTPAATKFYRAAPGQRAELRQELHVAGGTLEWLPQETILFREADASMATVAHIDTRSRFIGWELTCYGRPASAELFDAGRARQHFELWIDGHPTLLDHLRIDGTAPTMNSAWGLSGHAVLGTLLAYPATADNLDAARAHDGFACSLVDDVLSCRWVGNDGDDAKRHFVRLWQSLRPDIVGRKAVLPRIWAT
jgi:urease accessory protein